MKKLLISACALAMLLATAPAHAASDSTLVFDLETEDALVEEHTARLLWNLMTDNIVAENVLGWNSLFLEEPEAVSGVVTIDTEAGTVAGEIIERWVCVGDCLTVAGTPSWTTTRDTGFTATIVDGWIEADGSDWKIGGSVAIDYDASVTSNETPSDCDGEPCYTCEGQVCAIAGTASAAAELEGWVSGGTLSLAFADRLEANVDDMDFTDMRRMEFFMSRFSLTITGAMVPTVVQPPEEATVTTSDPATTGSTTTDPGSAAPIDSGAVTESVVVAQDSGASSDEETAVMPGGEPGQSERTPRTGLMVAVILIIVLLGGAALIKFLGIERRLEKKAREGDAARLRKNRPAPRGK